MVGRDGFLTIAHKSGKFGGIETNTTIKNVPVYNNGEWIEERDLVAICSVYRTDTQRPFIVEVSFKEYAGTTRDGQLTKFWKEKGATMLKKVAESQCLRKAFNVSGIYAEEELNDINVVPKVEEVVASTTTTDEVTAFITDDMKNQNVNIVTGEVSQNAHTQPEHEEVPAYMDDAVSQHTQQTLEIEV
jgi:hypothetical protein